MVRNFLYDTKSAYIYDIYVGTRFDSLTGDDLIKTLDHPRPITNLLKQGIDRPTRAMLVVGRAGTGKTLFIKHVFLSFRGSQSRRIPILVELRSLNRLPLDRLETRIFEDCVATGAEIIKEQILHGLMQGLFVIMLDGMDELNSTTYKHYEREIISFAVRYPYCPIIVSSRPIEAMKGWAQFDTYHVSPLTLQSAIDLVHKLEFDRNVKETFIELLTDDFYNEYKDFVGTPLLLTILLLTYSDSGRIAINRSEFFDEAFSALWSKHDARKEGYERQKYTKLNKSQFSQLLSAFAASAYVEYDYDIKDRQFNTHFAKAMVLSGVVCDRESFKKDCVISTSLLVEDGPYIRFCHRSLQEYFTAMFVTRVDDDSASESIEELSERFESDDVLSLVQAMYPEKIEKHRVLPIARAAGELISLNQNNVTNYAKEVTSEEFKGLSVNMRKIRYLYKFIPRSEELIGFMDAMRDMGTGLDEFFQPTSGKKNLFRKDMDNFTKLLNYLQTKYERKYSILKAIIKGSS
jgi:predicted NACHT family NTPase